MQLQEYATERSSLIWLRLTFPIALLLAVASGCGIFVEGIYQADAPYFSAQAVGQDLITLFVVVPVLSISAILAGKGSQRARLVWLGSLVYVLYTYIVAAFAVRFNALFLIYVALTGCSLYALIGGLTTTDMNRIQASFTERTPVRSVSIYLMALTVLFALLWLSEIIPALFSGNTPQSIIDNGTPTNAVHVLDLAWILPATGLASAALRRRRKQGYTFAGVLLTYALLLVLAVLSMVAYMTAEGHMVEMPQIIIFSLVLAVNVLLLILYLKELKEPGRASGS